MKNPKNYGGENEKATKKRIPHQKVALPVRGN